MQDVLITPVNLIWTVSEVVGRDNLYFLPNGKAFARFQGKTIVADRSLGGFLETGEVFGSFEFLDKIPSQERETILAKYRKGRKSFSKEQKMPEEFMGVFDFRDLKIDELQRKYLDHFLKEGNYFFQEQQRQERYDPFFPEAMIERYPLMKEVLQGLAPVHLFTRLFGNSKVRTSLFSKEYPSGFCPVHKNEKKDAVRITETAIYCLGCNTLSISMTGFSGPTIGRYFDGDSRNIRNFIRPYYEFNNPQKEGLPDKIEDLPIMDLFGLLMMYHPQSEDPDKPYLNHDDYFLESLNRSLDSK